MSRKSLNREVIRLAVPAIISNLMVPLLGLVDTAVAGHLGNVAALGAMAVGSMMLNVIFWVFGFLRMGTTGLEAEAFGAGDRRRCLDILKKGLAIAAVIAVVVLILQRPLLSLLLTLMGADAQVTALASEYYLYCIWGVPAQLIMMVMTGWFLGLQNTRVPMAIAIGVNALNVLLDVSLALWFGYGLRGIAIGTALSNWVGAFASLIICRRWIRGKGGSLPAPDSSRPASRIAWTRFFGVNANLFFRSACIMAVSLSMTAFGARMGELTLAANAVMMQFFMFFSYFMDGFAFAGEAMTGRYSGARDPEGLRGSVRALLGWGGAMALVFFLIYAAGCNGIAGLITDNGNVVAEVGKMYLLVVLLPPLTVLAFLFDGIYIGLTRTGTMLAATLAATAAFYLITCFTGHPTSHNNILWLGFECYLVLRGVILAINYAMDNGKLRENH